MKARMFAFPALIASENRWELEATANDRAVLVSGVRRTFLSEGPFYMPFKAVLTVGG